MTLLSTCYAVKKQQQQKAKGRKSLNELALIAVAVPLKSLFFKPQWHFLLAVHFILLGFKPQLHLVSFYEIKLKEIKERLCGW